MGVLEQAALRQAQGANVRARHGRPHGLRHRRQGRRQGPDRAGRFDRGRLDRRRLRARGGPQGGAPMHVRRPIAAGLDRAQGRARRTRRRGRRGARRRLLRQELLPEPGHDGYFRRAGSAEPATADPRRFAGRGGAGETGAVDGLRSHGRGGAGGTSAFRRLALRASRAFSPPNEAGDDAFVVVSTQGAGDRAALKSARGMEARYRAFVGSRRKAETLQQRTRHGRRLRSRARRDQGAGRASTSPRSPPMRSRFRSSRKWSPRGAGLSARRWRTRSTDAPRAV